MRRAARCLVLSSKYLTAMLMQKGNLLQAVVGCPACFTRGCASWWSCYPEHQSKLPPALSCRFPACRYPGCCCILDLGLAKLGRAMRRTQTTPAPPPRLRRAGRRQGHHRCLGVIVVFNWQSLREQRLASKIAESSPAASSNSVQKVP